MSGQGGILLALDLLGVFAFGLNGALTAIRGTRLDLVGVVALALVTALGGGVIRDLMIGAVPPASFSDWRYLTVATIGGLVAFIAGHRMGRLATPIVVMDAIGLGLFAVTGTTKALAYGVGLGPAIILGTLTAVGGGTVRDVLIRQVPGVLSSGLYAIPAIVAGAITAAAMATGHYGWPAALAAASTCIAVRLLGVRYGLNAPAPRGSKYHQ